MKTRFYITYYDFCFVNTFFIDVEILSKRISVPYVVFLWLLLHFQPLFLALTSIEASLKALNTKIYDFTMVCKYLFSQLMSVGFRQRHGIGGADSAKVTCMVDMVHGLSPS